MSEKDADVPVSVGDIVADKYRVEKVLGVGAMGVVVAAMHVDLQERRAIKFMRSSMLGDAEGVERFLREARAAVRLKSQHVAKVQDVGRLGTGAPYIVMEYLDGSDLKSILDARGALPVERGGRLPAPGLRGHRRGPQLRDRPPRPQAGQPVPDDGGERRAGGEGARLRHRQGRSGGAGPARQMTAMDQLLGTPLYMSPEQFLPSTRKVDTRSDIWALGVILYQMLAGRTPFSGGSITEICAAVMGDQPDSPAMSRPDVPPPVEAAVMRCLEKSPARRFGTATELAAALAPFASAPAGWSSLVPAQAAAPPPSARLAQPDAAPQSQASAPSQGPASSQQPVQAPPVQQARMPQARTVPLPPGFKPQAPMSQRSAPAVAAIPAPSAGNGMAPGSTSTQPATPAASSSKIGLAVAAIATVVLIGGGAAVALGIRGSGASPPSPAATATAAPAATPADTGAVAATPPPTETQVPAAPPAAESGAPRAAAPPSVKPKLGPRSPR